MPNTVSVEEVKTRLNDLLDRAHQGEEWVIVDAAGQSVAKLSAPPAKHEPVVSEPKQAQWPDFIARLRAQWPDGISGQLVSEIVDEGRGARP